MMERPKSKAQATALEVDGGTKAVQATALGVVEGTKIVHVAEMSSRATVAANYKATGFLRGDANRDRVILMNNAMVVLEDLFNGVGKINCDDAADANDDGSIDISDALGILFYLYGGGVAPAGIADFQTDRTPDALGCVSAEEGDSSESLEWFAPEPQVLTARALNDLDRVGSAQPQPPLTRSVRHSSLSQSVERKPVRSSRWNLPIGSCAEALSRNDWASCIDTGVGCGGRNVRHGMCC
jgi:hypothetical protein